jgi:predicted site-specific integrase-resolvase
MTKLLHIHEACEILSIGETMLREFIKAGDIEMDLH